VDIEFSPASGGRSENLATLTEGDILSKHGGYFQRAHRDASDFRHLLTASTRLEAFAVTLAASDGKRRFFHMSSSITGFG
jgi:hypothetical protein